MANTTSPFDSTYFVFTFVIAVCTVVGIIFGALAMLLRWQYYRSPWEMDFEIAEFPKEGQGKKYLPRRSEIAMPRGKYILLIMLRCRSTTIPDKGVAHLIVGSRPTSRAALIRALKGRWRDKQLNIWPSSTGVSYTIFPRVEHDTSLNPPRIQAIADDAEGRGVKGVTFSPTSVDMRNWNLDYSPQYKVAIGRLIRLFVEIEATDAWKGAIEFSTDISKAEGEEEFRYVSRKVVFK